MFNPGSDTQSEPGIVVCELDEQAPEWEIALKRAKPWRALARQGSIFNERKVSDPRSSEKGSF